MLRHRYLIALFAFFILLIGVPLLPNNFGGCLIFCSMMTFVVFWLAINDCCETQSHSATIVLAVSVIALNWGSLAISNLWLYLIHNLVFAAFFVRCGINILKPLFICKTIDGDSIRAAICVYILIGVAFAYVYGALLLLDVQAITFSSHENNLLSTFGQNSFPDLIYFSFVTMTTLGYGDVTPVSSLAKTIALVQAIGGQFYLAVLVAKLVVLTEFNARNPDSTQD